MYWIPFKCPPVICDFDTVKNAVTTEVHHDFEGEQAIEEYNAGGSFAKDVAYYGTYDALINLVQTSTSCAQYLGFKCSGELVSSSLNVHANQKT